MKWRNSGRGEIPGFFLPENKRESFVILRFHDILRVSYWNYHIPAYKKHRGDV